MPEERVIEGTSCTVADDGKVYRYEGGTPVELNQYKVSGQYLYVLLSINGEQKHVYVHRLVAEAFLPNPDNLPCVRHKNKDTFDNRADNLVWSSHSEVRKNVHRKDYGSCSICGAKLKSNRMICSECTEKLRKFQWRETVMEKRAIRLAHVDRDDLSPKHQEVYDRYLDNSIPTYRQIAKELDISHQRVEQIIRQMESPFKKSQSSLQTQKDKIAEALKAEQIQKKKAKLNEQLQNAVLRKQRAEQQIELFQAKMEKLKKQGGEPCFPQ